jgi:hypothetical protein
MTTTTEPTTGTGRGTASAAAAVTAVLGLALVTLVLTRPGEAQADYTSVRGWLLELTFLAYLVSTGFAAQALVHLRVIRSLAARLVQAGYGLIGVGVVIGMALRDDPDWFFALAGPGLLASFAGFVLLAVDGFRRRTLPRPVAVLGGVGGALAIPFAEVGTTLLVVVFWATLAVLLRRAPDR